MKKFSFSIIAFALLLTMALSSCGKAGDDSSQTKTSRPAGNQDATWGGTKDIDTSELLFADRKGVKGVVRVFVPWTVETRWNTIKSEFEKTYPDATLEYLSAPWATRDIKLISYVNSGNPPDAVSCANVDFPARAINEIIQPMDDLVDANNPILSQYLMNTFTSWEGKQYAMIGNPAPHVVYFNTKMFRDAGLKSPLDHYNENTWNWDTLRSLSMSLTEDTNNDGKTDIWGFGTDDEYIFSLANGTDVIKMENGKPVLNIDDPAFRGGMTFFYDMLNKDKCVYPDRWASFQDGFKQSKIAMCYWRHYHAKELTEEKFENWDVVPFPKAPGKEDYVGLMASDGWGLATGAKNRIGGMAFCEFTFNYHLRVSRSPANVSYYTEEQDTRVRDCVPASTYLYSYGLEGTFASEFCNLMRGNGSFSSLLEEYRPVWSKNIKDVLEGQ